MLKDILLVILSVIIWSTPVTLLQMFGYSIALSGLIYYKMGSEQAHAAYLKLAGDENSTFNRFRRSLWAKVGGGVLIIFVVLAMAHGFSNRDMIDTQRTHSGLTGAPDPVMGDPYYPETGVPYSGIHRPVNSDDKDDVPSTHMHDSVDDVPVIHSLDVVVYISPRADNSTITFFKDTLSIPSISAFSPRIFAYGSSTPDFPVRQHAQTISSAPSAYLDYITTHYSALAQHTVFLNSDVEVMHIPSSVLSRFNPRTGVAGLTSNGYAACTCLDCLDTSRTPVTKADELYALTNQDICSSTERLLVFSTRGFVINFVVNRGLYIRRLSKTYSPESQGGVRPSPCRSREGRFKFGEEHCKELALHAWMQ